MKTWYILLALVVLVAAGYGLDRGVLIGSKLNTDKLPGMPAAYSKQCNYLHFTGTAPKRSGIFMDSATADGVHCPLFDRQA